MGYIYRHIRLDKKEVFYIGMSLKEDEKYKRAFCIKNRNYLWNRVFQKLKKEEFIVEILFEHNSLDILKTKEIEFISLYGKKVDRNGTLCNLTNGGDGVGYKKPILKKDKIFIKYVINQVNKGKKTIKQCCILKKIDIDKFNRLYNELYPSDNLNIRKKSLDLLNKQKAKRISEIGKRSTKKTIKNIKNCIDLYKKGFLIKEISSKLSIKKDLIGQIIKENMNITEVKDIQKNNRSKVQLTWNNITIKRYTIDNNLVKTYNCIEKLETSYKKESLIAVFRKKKNNTVKYKNFIWVIDYIPPYKIKKNIIMIERTTSDDIKNLVENQIFVFGSNLSGRHGKGAAKTALGWGAIWGQAKGLQGKTYGIPTKNASIRRTLTLEEIKPFVNEFIEFAKANENLTFLVTEIGCGLAGLKPKEVAPLFKEAINISNIHLPARFWHKLK